VRSSALAAVVLLAALAALAGCGGGTQKSPADAYRDRADEICTSAQKALKTVGRPERPADYAGYLRRSLAAVAPSLAQLKALRPPPALRSLHSQWIARQQTNRHALQALLARVEGQVDPQAAIDAAAPAINRGAEQLNRIAKRIGFRVCGRT
jgi:hypothetical protein